MLWAQRAFTATTIAGTVTSNRSALGDSDGSHRLDTQAPHLGTAA
jgi:hypothetical protein